MMLQMLSSRLGDQDMVTMVESVHGDREMGGIRSEDCECDHDVSWNRRKSEEAREERTDDGGTLGKLVDGFDVSLWVSLTLLRVSFETVMWQVYKRLSICMLQRDYAHEVSNLYTSPMFFCKCSLMAGN